jgi:hypothetical protein
LASTQWTKHLRSEKEKEDFLAILGNSTTVLYRLRDILVEELTGINNSECSISDFEDASWSHKQAFRNGERARIKKLLDLLQPERKK